MYDDLLAYLEADLVGAERPVARRRHFADPTRLLTRAAELANEDWSEAEAARELGHLASADCLRAAHIMVLGSLMRNPFVDVRGIRVARILVAAIDEHRTPLPPPPPALRRSGRLARLFRRH